MISPQRRKDRKERIYILLTAETQRKQKNIFCRKKREERKEKLFYGF